MKADIHQGSTFHRASSQADLIQIYLSLSLQTTPTPLAIN